MPTLLDAQDALTLGRIVLYSALVLWAALVAGLAVRLFVLIGGI